jgi:hypothetical protein
MVVFAVLAASVVLQGPRLGRLIEGALPPNQGKIHLGGVTWHLRALVDLATDAPSPVAVDGLQIVDPEGTVVLDVPHLDARVRLRTLIGGSFSINDLRVPKALWRFSQLKHGDAIGFIAALAPRTPPPPPAPGAPQGPGSFFQITGAELGDFTAMFDFPGAWGLELRQIHGHASVIQSSVDPLHPIFGFDAGSVVAEGGGWLRILDDNVLPFDRVVINRISTTQDAPDDIVLDLGEADTGRSQLTGKGSFTGIYGATSVPGIELHVAFSEAGDALSAVVAGKKIEGLAISGRGATVSADLSQSFAKLKVAAAIRGLDVRYDAYRALGLGLDLGFDAGAGKVDVTRLGFAAPGGGKLGLDAHLDTNRLTLQAGLRLAGFHTESYLPAGLRAMAGGRLDGRVDARADLTKKSAQLGQVDLRFARAGRGAGLPRAVRVHGSALLSPERVKTDGLTVSVTGADATARGSIDLDRQLIDLGLAVVASDLGRLLGEMGLPPLAKDARLDAHAGGSFDDPQASGVAVVHGLGAGGHTLPQLDAQFGIEHGLARLDRLSGPAFGGQIDAHGTLRLWEQRASRPLRSPIVDFRLEARGIDLATVAPDAGIEGRLTVFAEAHGPLDAPEARVQLPAGTTFTALGDSYAVGPIDARLEGRTLAIRTLRLARAAGGALDVHGQVGLEHQDLDLDVVLSKLPIAGLPGVATAGIPVSGLVSARLHLGGRPDRPELTGNIDFAEVIARGVHLGAGHLALAPARVGPTHTPGVAVHGQLFDRFDVDADVALLPKGPSVHGRVAFHRLEIQTLAPELVALGDGRGIVSGRVAVDLDPGQPLELDVLLPELWLSIARAVEGSNGETTIQRVRIEAARPVHLHLAGPHIALDEAHFATDGGDLRVEGRLDGRAISGAVDGHLDLELLEPFLGATPIQQIGGDLRASLRASGTLDRPDVQGEVAIVNPIRIRPRGFDRDVVVGSGRFALGSGGGMAIEHLAITVEGSTMNLSGHASLGAGFVPENIQADVDGDVSARLLAFAAPDAVSDSQGKAHVRAHLRGTLLHPEIRGRLDLGTIDFRLRDLGSEVQVQSGIVEISNEGVILHNVKVLFDGQGLLVIGDSGVRAGRVQFSTLFPFKPGLFDLPLHGERLSYRSPGVFDVEDLAFDVDLKGNVDDGFKLGGEVRLVSGRYLQSFNVKDLAISPRVDESTVRPFYEGKPLLEKLRLDLSVRTVGDGFVVQNNIAPEIHVDIVLHVGGILSVPQLAGDVRPTDGRFNIPFMRGDFDLVPNVNHVTFIATKSVSDGDTPDLDIQAQNLVTDSNGVDHNVHMRISGPLREAQIDLSSDDGLDRNQTAFLLLTGRTSASDAAHFGTQNATVGANLSTGADIAGQATRDTVASLMEPYIDSNFQRVTGFNLRLTVGSDGVEGRLRKRVSRYWSVQSDYLQGFQNQSHWTTQADTWILDYVSAGFGFEQVRLSSEQGVPETLPLNYNLELRLDYAIRIR